MQLYIPRKDIIDDVVVIMQQLSSPEETLQEWQGFDEQKELVLECTETNGIVKYLHITPEYENLLDSITATQKLEDFLGEQYQSLKEGIESTDEESQHKSQIDLNLHIKQTAFSVKQMVELIEDHKDVDLAPEFQRRLVWNKKQKSQLIESLLLAIPIPAFYFSETPQGSFQVIDGLQRLTTISDFVKNRFKLSQLEYLDEVKSKTFAELDRKYQRKIEITQLYVYIIESHSSATLQYDIFKRINKNGTVLNYQEMRHAIALPRVRKLWKNMVETDFFKQATNNSIKDNRMGDQELALRFIAFSLPQSKERYGGDMITFLDETANILNIMPDNAFKEFEQKTLLQFNNAMQNARHLFGEYAFRKCLLKDLAPQAYKQIINKALFLAWSIALSQYDAQIVQQQNEAGSFAKHQAIVLEPKSDFYQTITNTTSNKSSLLFTFQQVEQLLNTYLKYDTPT